MKPNAMTSAQQAARWLQQHSGAKVTITIAADVDLVASASTGDTGHIVVGTFCPSVDVVKLLLAATLKKIQQQSAPATIALGRGGGKRGVW